MSNKGQPKLNKQQRAVKVMEILTKAGYTELQIAELQSTPVPLGEEFHKLTVLLRQGGLSFYAITQVLGRKQSYKRNLQINFKRDCKRYGIEPQEVQKATIPTEETTVTCKDSLQVKVENNNQTWIKK